MYTLLYGFIWSLSKLPLKVLYALSDIIFVLVYYIVRYRRRVVSENLHSSFPEKNATELKHIEKEFYQFFSDYIVETIKLCSISEKELTKRMEFCGVEQMINKLRTSGKDFAFIYLAHYGNWEWIASLAMHIHNLAPEMSAGQIYHPLRNKNFNKLFLQIRGRFGGDNVGMKETLRYVINKRKAQIPTIVGFIADQGPKWNSIHHWTEFLNHKTPVFTGTEQIGKKVDALIFYGHVERPKRGTYRCTIKLMEDNIQNKPDYQITDKYFDLLEGTIKQHPALWLWTHKRWKRNYEEYVKRQKSQS